MLARLKGSVPGRLALKFNEDRALNWATLIAWSGLLAMFPILLVMVSILGLFFSTAGIDTAALFDKIASAFPGDTRQHQDILDALSSFKRQGGIFAVVGFAGLMAGGSALIGAMEQGFAVIYHCKPRSFIRQKLMAFGMILVFTVLGGVAVGSSSILPALKSLSFVPGFLTSGLVAFLLQFVLGVLSGLLLFLAIYYVVPNRRQEWAKVWPGALLAGTLFEVVTLVFPLYVEVNKGIGNYGKTFALFFTLMTFFYFMGIVTMVGVELNSILYPVPVQQPEATQALAPPGGDPALDAPARRDDGVPARPLNAVATAPRTVALLGAGVIGWAVGVAVGERRRGRRLLRRP